MSLADRTPPTAEEFHDYRERFRNWGRWGDDDQLGTLNHVTAEARAHALTLPQAGRTVSCSYDWATLPGPLNPQPAQQYTQVGAAGSTEYVGVSYHGRVTTHVDALCHVFAMPEQLMYNGRPGSLVRSYGGARVNSIHAWRNGVVTRGVLYDIPRLRGVDFVTVDEPVHGWELEDAARAQGVEPRPGDAVLIRCGRDAFYAAHPDVELLDAAGVHASTLEYLYEHDAALLGWDLLDAAGQGYPGTVPMGGGRMMSVPVHEIAIPYMGMPLIDNTNSKQLAEACAELGRYEFLFMMAPLAIRGGTGSPVNPIAVL